MNYHHFVEFAHAVAHAEYASFYVDAELKSPGIKKKLHQALDISLKAITFAP